MNWPAFFIAWIAVSIPVSIITGSVIKRGRR